MCNHPTIRKKSLDFDQTALIGGLVYSFSAVLFKIRICPSSHLPFITHTTAVFIFWQQSAQVLICLLSHTLQLSSYSGNNLPKFSFACYLTHYSCLHILATICPSSHLPVISHTTAVFTFWQLSAQVLICLLSHTLKLSSYSGNTQLDKHNSRFVLCKRSKDSFTGLAFVLFETISLTIFLRKHQKLWLTNCKSNDNTKATVSQSLRYASITQLISIRVLFFIFLLPPFLPLQKLLVTPQLCCILTHVYRCNNTKHRTHRHSCMLWHVTRFRLTSAEGLFKIEADVRLES